MSYSYTPERAGKTAYIVFPAIIIISLLAAAVTRRTDIARYVSMGALTVILADILVMTKVLLTSYTYTVTDDEGTADLVITRRVGKKSVTVCRVSIRDGRFDSDGRTRVPDGTAVYNYMPGLGRKGGCIFFPCEAEGGGAIRFAPDSEIKKILTGSTR